LPTEYNGLGNVTRRAILVNAASNSAVDPNTDMVTEYVYDDASGNYPGMLVSQKVYYGGNPRKSATTTYGYDGLGRQNLIIDPASNVIAITYDSTGQLINARQEVYDNPLDGEPNMVVTTGFFYDSLNRLSIKVEIPDVYDTNSNRVTSYNYDALGNLVQETRPDNIVNVYTYNALSQLEQKIADYGDSPHINQTTRYTYDRLGRQETIKGYANGVTEQTTTYTYDKLSRITNVEYPDSNSITFAYYSSGNVKKRIDQRGIVSTYAYNDTYNLLTKTVDGNGVTSNALESFTYDGLGRMLTAINTVGPNTISEIELAYNGLGNITDSNQKLLGGTKREFNFTYDQAGYLTKTTYPVGIEIRITPNWQGRIDTLGYKDSSNDWDMIKYQYIGNQVARRSYVKYNPNVISDYSYDNLGRITCINAYRSTTTLIKFDYTYEDKTNNIASQTYNHRTSAPHNDFAYDNIDRLTRTDYGVDTTNEQFAMDKLGNRTSVHLRDGNNVSYSVNNLTNRYNSVGPNNLSYDKAGNLTKDKSGYEYEYDYENRIVKIKKSGSTKAQYSYDALGRRVEKKDLVTSANTRRYYYNNNWQVLEERDSSDNFKKWLAYGNYIDELLFSSESSSNPTLIRIYLHDQLYSPVALLHFAGSVVLERYEYDAYGKPYIRDSQYALRSTSSYGNNYLFTGRETDILDNSSLKIQNNRNRSYDYSTGRWLQQDPLGYVDGMNLYEYVKSDPISLTDPKGLWGGEHKKFTEDAFNKVVGHLSGPPPMSGCKSHMLSTLISSNTSQDNFGSPQSGDLRRHYNRPVDKKETDSDKEGWDRAYGDYIVFEKDNFSVTLKQKPPSCENALGALGRWDHSLQDFYGHAIPVGPPSATNPWSAWSIGVTGDPYNRDNFWPSSYSLGGGGEHPPVGEPAMTQAEYTSRYNATSSFMQGHYSQYLTRWWTSCSCWCNSKYK
jgi:RHS repeat-associated protein